eukprot:UC4_evm6s1059
MAATGDTNTKADHGIATRNSTAAPTQDVGKTTGAAADVENDKNTVAVTSNNKSETKKERKKRMERMRNETARKRLDERLTELDAKKKGSAAASSSADEQTAENEKQVDIWSEVPSSEAGAPLPTDDVSQEQAQILLLARLKELEKQQAAQEKLESLAAPKQNPEDIKPENFISATSFEGSKEGFVFKTGPQGVGYYKDVPNESTAPEVETFERIFTQARWGMNARLTGGPVIITNVKPDGEGSCNGVQVGDEIVNIGGKDVRKEREEAIQLIRKGGEQKVIFARSSTAQPVIPGTSAAGSTSLVEGKTLSAAEQSHMQAMIGQAQAKDTVAFAGVSGSTETVGEDRLKPSSTLVISGCKNCNYTVEAMCTKVFLQGCQNCKISFNAKVITATIEVFKCHSMDLTVDTYCGTLQCDMSNGIAIRFTKQEHFYVENKDTGKNTSMIVWAGCEDFSVETLDTQDRLNTSFTEMKSKHPNLVAERSQFRIKFEKGKDGKISLKQEKVIRLPNGFFTTEKEKAEFEAKQEATLKAMADSLGIKINPAPKKGRASLIGNVHADPKHTSARQKIPSCFVKFGLSIIENISVATESMCKSRTWVFVYNLGHIIVYMSELHQ